MHVSLRNDIGMIKECKIGFSWTNLFFGFFCPLFRADWKYLLIMILVDCLTFGFSSLIFPFFYNKLYINELLSKGYYPASETDREILVNKGFLLGNNKF